MKKAKFILKRTITPIIVATTIVNNANIATYPLETQKRPQIQLQQKQMDYGTNHNEYEDLKIMKDIFCSKLNNLTDTNYPKDLIKKELQNYLNKINSNSLKLAKAYKDFGNHKINQTGLTFEEILQSPKYNSHVFEAPFFIQERLEVLTDISSGINSTNRINYYKNKSENSYNFLDDNRNLLDEIDNFLNDFKIFLQFYIVFSCKSYGNIDNNSISFYVKYNLDEIKFLAFNDKKDKDTYDYLLSLINFNVEILPDGLLGSKSMSRSLFYQYASRQLINSSITHLTNIGYDLSELTTPQKHNSITMTK